MNIPLPAYKNEAYFNQQYVSIPELNEKHYFETELADESKSELSAGAGLAVIVIGALFKAVIEAVVEYKNEQK